MAYSEGTESHWWHLTRNKIIRAQLKKFAGPDSAVLDVGCGRGITVKYLRQHGVDCEGADLATPRALTGMEKHIHFGVDVRELPEQKRSRYHIILLLDVIEHLPDPLAFLRSLGQAFASLSHILISVPARPELWSNYDEFYGHHRRYTAEMVEDLARQLGWGLAYRRYFFRPLYPPARILVALGKQRKIRIDAPQGMGKIAHRFIAYLMNLDFHLVPGCIPGTSMLACFRLQDPSSPDGSPRSGRNPERT